MRPAKVVWTFCCLLLLTLTVRAAQNVEIILDCNQVSDTTGIEVTGSWTSVAASTDYGTGSIHDQGTGNTSSTKTVRFRPTLPTDGVYRVSLWWRQNTNRANDVPVRINHAGGQTDVTVNQRVSGSQWNVIGTFRFVQGTTNNVLIRTTTSTGIVGADAIRFSLVTPDVIVDNTAEASSPNSNVVISGNWSSLPASDASAYGGSYLATTTASTETGSATFNAVLPEPGTYDVYAQWFSPASGAGTVQVPLTIGGVDLGLPYEDSTSVPQSSQESRHWHYVKRYRFDKGADGIVRGSVRFSNKWSVPGLAITADAVRFAKVAESQDVVDNLDASPAIRTNAAWSTSATAPTKFGHNFADNVGITALREMTFEASLPLTTKYDVYVWWRANANNSPAVPVTITHRTGVVTITAPQNTGGGTWWHAGRYEFDSAARASVKISTQGTTGVVVADAVCFVRDPDSDWDGMPDQWEIDHFQSIASEAQTRDANFPDDYDRDGISNLSEYLQKTDPLDFFNGVKPDIRILSENDQFAEPGTFVPQGLSVKVFKSTDPGAELWRGAPVRFLVQSGGGALVINKGDAALDNPVELDSPDGRFDLHFLLPDTHGTECKVEVAAGLDRIDPEAEYFKVYTHELAGSWRFDEASGTRAEDSSPTKSHPGELLGGIERVRGFGTTGSFEEDSAVSLNGSSQYILVAEPTSPISERPLTFELPQFAAVAWVQLRTPVSLASDTDIHPILSKWDPSSAGGFDLVLKGGAGHGIAFRIYGPNGSILREIRPAADVSAKILNGGPHLIVFTRGVDNHGRLYLDGVEVGSQSAMSDSLTTTAPLWIGKDAAGRHLRAMVDDVRLYKSVLRPDEIEAMYKAFDSDKNGMADAWEIEKFGAVGRDGSVDSDGDKRSDWQEYVQGSDPHDYFNGVAPKLEITDGNRQIGAPGQVLPIELAVDISAADASGADIPLEGATLTFTVHTGSGAALALNAESENFVAVLATSSVLENERAVAKAFLKLPDNPGADVAGQVSAGGASEEFIAQVSGLASYLKLDEASGLVANDTTKRGRSGTFSTDVARAKGPDASNAPVFSGGDVLSIENIKRSVIPAGASAFTISLWLKTGEDFLTGALLTNRSVESTGSGFTIGIDAGKLLLWSDDTGGSIVPIRSSRVVADGRWHHVVVTYSGLAANLYVDGQLTATGAVHIIPNERPIVFGVGLTDLKPFRGMIDEVKFYRGIEFTASDVSNTYQTDIGSFDTDEDGLKNRSEIEVYHTDPESPDTDGDGVSDREEVENGTNPNRHAGQWNIFEIYVSAGRAGHNFALEVNQADREDITKLGLVENDTTYGAFTSLRAELSVSLPNTLIDLTTGERLELSIPNEPTDSTEASLMDKRSSAWQSAPNGAPARQYFLIGPDRVGHALLLAQRDEGNTVYYHLATVGAQINAGAVDPADPAARFEASAVFNPELEFWVIDLNTGQRSASYDTNLATTTWTVNEVAPPVTQTYLFLDSHQVGQSFTIYSRVPGGTAQQVGVVTGEALQCSAGGWFVGTMDEDFLYTKDHHETEVVIPEGAAYIATPVGVGMEFWITRNADNTSSPVMQADGTHVPLWVLSEHFGPVPPVRDWAEVTFRLPVEDAPDGSAPFVVRHEDGLLSVPATGYTTDFLVSYDDYGNVDSKTLWFVEFTTTVDISQNWWLVDQSKPEKQFEPLKRDFTLWQPTHIAPPGGSMWVQIFGGRVGHALKLRQGTEFWDIPTTMSNLEPVANSGGSAAYIGGAEMHTQSVLNSAQELLYSYSYIQVSVPYAVPAPGATSPSDFQVVDQTTGEQASLNVSDLRQWFTKPEAKQLAISSSRFGHKLYLCHPNGDEFEIQQHAIQGNYSTGPDGASWFNSYYYYDATAQWRDFLDWWIEDRTAGDSTETASSFVGTGKTLENTLIDWIALPRPQALTAEVVGTPAHVKLTWTPNGASPDGSFLIHRKTGNDGSMWQTCGTVLATDADGDGQFDFVDASPLNSAMVYYRVVYSFGGQISGPSDQVLVSESEFNDSDGDGISDKLEEYYGRNPFDASDRDRDSDGDGTSDLGEILGLRDPSRPDAPILQLSVFGVTAP